jgi:hypothetical protein
MNKKQINTYYAEVLSKCVQFTKEYANPAKHGIYPWSFGMDYW